MRVIVAEEHRDAILSTSPEDLEQLRLDVHHLLNAGKSESEIAKRIADAGWTYEFGARYVATMKVNGPHIELVLPAPKPMDAGKRERISGWIWVAVVLCFYLGQAQSWIEFGIVVVLCLGLLIAFGRQLRAVFAWVLFAFNTAFTLLVFAQRWPH